MQRQRRKRRSVRRAPDPGNPGDDHRHVTRGRSHRFAGAIVKTHSLWVFHSEMHNRPPRLGMRQFACYFPARPASLLPLRAFSSVG